jgi:hypothetical protein
MTARGPMLGVATGDLWPAFPPRGQARAPTPNWAQTLNWAQTPKFEGPAAIEAVPLVSIDSYGQSIDREPNRYRAPMAVPVSKADGPRWQTT